MKKQILKIGIIAFTLIMGVFVWQSCSNELDVNSLQENKKNEVKTSEELSGLDLVICTAMLMVEDNPTNSVIITIDDKNNSDFRIVQSELLFPRFKARNPEYIKEGWTYLGVISDNVVLGVNAAIKLYKQYKINFNKSCVDLRLENDRDGINIYVRDCK